MEIFEFGNSSSQYRGKYEDLVKECWFINLKQIFDHLRLNKSCHVRILEGDYAGSVAKFTVSESFIEYVGDKLTKRLPYTPESYYFIYYFSGKLSWKGKRNNPKYTIRYKDCAVLLDYQGEEIFKKFNPKKENERLLQAPLLDINGGSLAIGDKVLYINARYGQGACLSQGIITKFKPEAKEGRVSVVITNVEQEEESILKYSEKQIYKMQEV